MAALNKSKPYDRIHGPDPLNRLYMQEQFGEVKYFDSKGQEVIDPDEKPARKRGAPQGNANAAKLKVEPAPEIGREPVEYLDGEATHGTDPLDVDAQLAQQGM